MHPGPRLSQIGASLGSKYRSPSDGIQYTITVPEPSIDGSFYSTVRPLLKTYCYKCHGYRNPKGKFNLRKFLGEKAVRQNYKLFRELVNKVRTREMPPKKAPQPTEDERRAIAGWYEAALGKIDLNIKATPGRVVCRRLNRTEYRNVVRDLLGVDYDTQGNFPFDDVGYGFDNIGDILALPPLLMEKYIAASREIVDRAMKAETRDELILLFKPDKEMTERNAARYCLSRFTSRAFRRPVTVKELDRLLKLFDAAKGHGLEFEEALKFPLRTVLISPHFLFRFEQNVSAADKEGVQAIGDFEVASRLSFFIWSSMPDDELFSMAVRNKLGDGDAVAEQALRLLEDGRSSSLAENFAPQWLQIRRLLDASLDPKFDVDEQLRKDMIREAVVFFEHIVNEDRSVLEFIQADYTFVNERLAKHYSIPGITGERFQRVSIKDGRRGGVLTMAAVLAATSDPDRTSPVKRGKWVLEAIFGTPPPPPIPGADSLKEGPSTAGLSLRKRLEKHRADPACATCHNRMDPIGFGLENFNAAGAWRDTQDGKPIDTAATLPDGTRFRGPVELKAVFLKRKARFLRALVEKMLTYALGRGMEPPDGPTIEKIAQAVEKKDYRMSSLVAEIVKSYPFRYRQKDGGK